MSHAVFAGFSSQGNLICLVLIRDKDFEINLLNEIRIFLFPFHLEF